MRRTLLFGASLIVVVLVGGFVVWPRVESLCLEGRAATEAGVREGGISVEGRTYLVAPYVSADYGAYLFPGGFLRGHPVAVAVRIRAADDAGLTEITPKCIRVSHNGDSIERRAQVGLYNGSRSDGSGYAEVIGGIRDLPEWTPGDTVHVWVRLTVRGRNYMIDVGETTISSVA
jgi:hypothetical protein